MRKIALLLFVLLFSVKSYSQFKLGFQFSPVLSANRVDYESDTESIGSDGTALKVSFGPIADFAITEHYYVSTGVLFCSKRAGFEGQAGNSPASTEEYNLQYVQIPATMKLFTNEVSLDKRVYFQFGGTFDFNIKEEADKDEYVLVEDFRFFDFTLLAGLGLEYQVGTSTILYSGLSYHRGLINAVSEQFDGLGGDLTLKNDYFALNLGIKF
ncbi:porin family protein [Fulvivirga lutea]|uniref:PorT family protein n=1 Tax=Fulvivirga lutea TaxID=2810512 RepID=A0A975A1A3_9BACT|nr:porin family protein [Fulvivirga lutea]QSE98229.1 PorT family protein [Fulvivirga lutea]